MDALAALIAAARNGDQRAFAALYDRFGKMVHAILLARLPVAEAEDQVQEVFLLAWTKIAQLDDVSVFGAWLGTIARNRAVDWWRRSRPTEPLSAQHADQATSSADIAEAHHVVAAIQALPEAYRETLLMRLCEGMSGPEIASVTGLEPGSVRVNLHRGMKLLRDKLGVEQRMAANE